MVKKILNEIWRRFGWLCGSAICLLGGYKGFVLLVWDEWETAFPFFGHIYLIFYGVLSILIIGVGIICVCGFLFNWE